MKEDAIILTKPLEEPSITINYGLIAKEIAMYAIDKGRALTVEVNPEDNTNNFLSKMNWKSDFKLDIEGDKSEED